MGAAGLAGFAAADSLSPITGRGLFSCGATTRGAGSEILTDGRSSGTASLISSSLARLRPNSQSRSPASMPRLFAQRMTPRIANSAIVAYRTQACAASAGMKLVPQRRISAPVRPITPPMPPGNPVTAPSRKSESAILMKTIPPTTPATRRPSPPVGFARHNRTATTINSGMTSATAGPSRVSSPSAIQAPGVPSKLRAGPAAAVFIDGSFGL